MIRFLWKKKKRPDLAKKISDVEILQKANEIARRKLMETQTSTPATMLSWDKRRKPIKH